MTNVGYIKMDYIDKLSQRLSMDFQYPDSNNNNKSPSKDKYSLRPRSMRRCPEDDENSSFTFQTTKARSKSKQKQKPAPLSKYRRKTANARERSRMREINAAFETLRKAVPHRHNEGIPSPSSEKLTKITTLRLAMKYINALSSVLSESSQENSSATLISDFGDLLSDCSDLDCLFLESDGESMNLQSDLSEHSLTPDMTESCLTSINLNMSFTEQFDQSLSPGFSDQNLSPFDSLFPDFS